MSQYKELKKLKDQGRELYEKNRSNKESTQK